MTLNEVIIPSLDTKFCPETRVKVQTQNVSSTFIIKFFAPLSENLKNVIFNKHQIEVVISSFGFSLITKSTKERKELAYLSLEDLHFRQLTSEKTTDTLFTLGSLTLDNPSSHKPIFPKVFFTSVSKKGSKFTEFLKLFQNANSKIRRKSFSNPLHSMTQKKFVELKVSKSMLKNGSLFDLIDIDLQTLHINLDEQWINEILTWVYSVSKIKKKIANIYQTQIPEPSEKQLKNPLTDYLWQCTVVHSQTQTFVKSIHISDFQIRLHFLQNLDDHPAKPLNQMKEQILNKLGVLIPNLKGIRLKFDQVRETHTKYRPLGIVQQKLRKNYVSQAVTIGATKLPQILVSSIIRIPKSLFNVVKDSIKNALQNREEDKNRFLELDFEHEE